MSNLSVEQSSALNPRVLMLDNYDSFTYNLVHYLEQLSVEVIVKRNDQVSLGEIAQIKPTHIVISPGPCDPDKAGLSLAIIKEFKGSIPILGVCLGHQAIGQVFGGEVVRADKPVHGKVSRLHHSGEGIFKDLNPTFDVVRYHSLVLEPNSLPDCLQVTAWIKDKEGKPKYVMGIKHKALAIEGVQFHPESVMSDFGLELLKNFINIYQPHILE